MKRFLIHVSTYWCGMDNTFRAMAESELDLYDIAQDLAYENFQSYGCEADIAEEEGYDPDETGRFIVKSLTTGKTYYVEPIGNGHPADWGDINPATKKIEGDYGQKYTGCVSEKDSLITEENGFHLIETLGPGISPISVIYQRDLSYEQLNRMVHEIHG